MIKTLIEDRRLAALAVLRSQARDTQRRRVYAADRRLGLGRQFASFDEARACLDQIIGSRWWKAQVRRSNYLNPSMAYDYPKLVRLRDQPRGKFSSGNWWTATIRLTSEHLCVRVMLHELAHVVTPFRYKGHGPEFASNYLRIIRHVQGDEAWKAMKAAFNEERVRWIGQQNTQG